MPKKIIDHFQYFILFGIFRILVAQNLFPFVSEIWGTGAHYLRHCGTEIHPVYIFLNWIFFWSITGNIPSIRTRYWKPTPQAKLRPEHLALFQYEGSWLELMDRVSTKDLLGPVVVFPRQGTQKRKKGIENMPKKPAFSKRIRFVSFFFHFFLLLLFLWLWLFLMGSGSYLIFNF